MEIKIKRAIITLIIVMLITVVYLNFSIGKIEELKIPTGNINIIDIVNKNPIEEDDNITEPVIHDDELGIKVEDNNKIIEQEKIKDLLVYDKYTNFESENLRIFTDPYYEFREKIAPGSNNIYEFVVENNFDFDIIYKISMIETNDYNINMKYKLRKNNDYLIGNKNTWVNASELEIDNIELLANSKDNYYLEWKWLESSNDTLIGETIDADYGLGISIGVKRADEE